MTQRGERYQGAATEHEKRGNCQGCLNFREKANDVPMNDTLRQWSLLIVVILLLALVGCKKKDLDRNVAMTLLQGRSVTVAGSFQAYAAYAQSSSASGWYQQLIYADVITCSSAPVCQPRRLAGGLQQEFSNFNFVAGSLIPAEVTGVTQTGPNSAMAQVRLTFQPSQLYAQYQNAFDHLTAEAQVMGGGGPVRPQTQRTTAEAVFQRYDDGWRIQTFDLSGPLPPLQFAEGVPPTRKDVVWTKLDAAMTARATSVQGLLELMKGRVRNPSDQHILSLVDTSRAELLAAATPKGKLQANVGLDEALGSLDSLMSNVENQPGLQTDAVFLKLEDELAGLENQITVGRRMYLEIVPGDTPTVGAKKSAPKVKF
jgi:hypothetical protein